MEKSASQEDGVTFQGKFKDYSMKRKVQFFTSKLVLTLAHTNISIMVQSMQTVKLFNHRFQDIKYLIIFTYLCIL